VALYGGCSEPTDRDAVQHVYAVMEEDPSKDEAVSVRWRDVTSDTDGAFPLTVWDAN
jgi:hypothetical protein